MNIKTTRGFDKKYVKLQPKIKQQFQKRLVIFVANQLDQRQRNHSLVGRYKGYRSIDITGDVRALYVVKDGTCFIFAFVGSHSQLY